MLPSGARPTPSILTGSPVDVNTPIKLPHPERLTHAGPTSGISILSFFFGAISHGFINKLFDFAGAIYFLFR